MAANAILSFYGLTLWIYQMDLSCINAWIADALGLRMWLKHYIFLTQKFVDAISVVVGDGKQSLATHAN
jgi:hypothetical protein